MHLTACYSSWRYCLYKTQSCGLRHNVNRTFLAYLGNFELFPASDITLFHFHKDVLGLSKHQQVYVRLKAWNSRVLPSLYMAFETTDLLIFGGRVSTTKICIVQIVLFSSRRYRMKSPGTCHSRSLSCLHRSSRLEWSEWWICPARIKAIINSISFFSRKQFLHRHVSLTWVIRWSSGDADTESLVKTARAKWESNSKHSGSKECLNVSTHQFRSLKLQFLRSQTWRSVAKLKNASKVQVRRYRSMLNKANLGP